jgi:dephospho-CoA kinase
LLRVGITGGIGTGKTTVCRLFEYLGVPVYAADLAAKRLMREDPALIKRVQDAFGPESYLNGEPNRPFLAQSVFGNPQKLELLNSLVHPAVFQDFEHWCSLQKDAPYVIKEAAIMFESGSYKQVHTVVVVAAPLELRLQRVKERDGLADEDILKRIASQMPQETLISRADAVILNDGSHSLIKQVIQLHQRFLNTAGATQEIL